MFKTAHYICPGVFSIKTAKNCHANTAEDNNRGVDDPRKVQAANGQVPAPDHNCVISIHQSAPDSAWVYL